MNRMIRLNAAVGVILLPLLMGAGTESVAKKCAIAKAKGTIHNCSCYTSEEAKNLKPWQLAWGDPDKLRKQTSHCICRVTLDSDTDQDCYVKFDFRNDKDWNRYLNRGPLLKGDIVK
jgi:hypothetical protein